MTDKVTEIFYLADEFCNEFDKVSSKYSLEKDNGKKSRKRKFTMSDSEVITILILFHIKSYRNFKHFYINHVQKNMLSEFPKTVSYNRFLELKEKVLLPMSVFLQTCCLGECTGISFIDSTPIRVCHIKREKQHRVFEGFATKGQCSMGWFYGFKLHIVINDKGELLDFLHSWKYR